ncbi:hypothetical protein JYP51_09550 [Ponticoccus gilvus]|nr:hypothetical protein [Enemella evansiae]
MPDRFTEPEMLALCGSAMAKIDTRGRRGTEMVTHDEIEALAAYVECTGGGPACQEAFHARLGDVQAAARAVGGAA